MPDTDRVLLLALRDPQTDPPAATHTPRILASTAADGAIHEVTGHIVRDYPGRWHWWAPLPSDQGLTVEDVRVAAGYVGDRASDYAEGLARRLRAAVSDG